MDVEGKRCSTLMDGNLQASKLHLKKLGGSSSPGFAEILDGYLRLVSDITGDDEGKCGEKTHLFGYISNLVNNGTNYQPQLVDVGCLKHQKYDLKTQLFQFSGPARCKVSPKTATIGVFSTE